MYDVTGFLNDHPGGEDYILQHAAKDVSEVMQNAELHDHSSSAYDMLEEYIIGRLGTDETIVRDGEYWKFCFRSVTQLIWMSCADWEATDDFHPDNTDSAVDYEKNQFLDLRKPLFMQMWRAKFRYYAHPASRITRSYLGTASCIILNKSINHDTCQNLRVFLVQIF